MNIKNKYGQYFTQRTIADFMVSLIGKSRDCRVLGIDWREDKVNSKLVCEDAQHVKFIDPFLKYIE